MVIDWCEPVGTERFIGPRWSVQCDSLPVVAVSKHGSPMIDESLLKINSGNAVSRCASVRSFITDFDPIRAFLLIFLFFFIFYLLFLLACRFVAFLVRLPPFVISWRRVETKALFFSTGSFRPIRDRGGRSRDRGPDTKNPAGRSSELIKADDEWPSDDVQSASGTFNQSRLQLSTSKRPTRNYPNNQLGKAQSNLVEPSQTYYNPVKPSQTWWNQVKPSKTQ